jgi:DNA-binding GntR family transcriptional regulator
MRSRSDRTIRGRANPPQPEVSLLVKWSGGNQSLRNVGRTDQLTETLVFKTKRSGPTGTSAWITEVLRDAIFAGKLRPGDRIVEGKLAKELGVGISPVREALQQLEHLGLVTRYLNRGTYVTQLTVDELDQIYRLRTELEVLSVKYAVEARDKSGLAQLQELADLMMSARAKGDVSRYFDYDLEFHLQICRIAADPFLEKCLLTLLTPFFAYVRIRLQQGPTLLDLIESSKEHQAIVDIIRSSDPIRAGEDMRTILKHFFETDVRKLYGVSLHL